MANDPYLIDVKKNKEFKKEFSGKKLGLFCPKRNKEISGECKVCDEVQRLFNTGEEEDKEKAFQKMAKPNIYMCVVFPENKDKIVLLELGKKVGSYIINGVDTFGWRDIAHPGKGKGREMMITKSKGDSGFNNYSASPNTEKADWAIPKSVLNSLPDLTHIVELLTNPEDSGVEIYKISNLKMDETLRFRICPPKDPENLPWVPAFRHWGVTQEQIDGKAPVHVDETEVEDDIDDEKIFANTPEKPKDEVKRPSCFGQDIAFDKNDPECTDCSHFKACARALM